MLTHGGEQPVELALGQRAGGSTRGDPGLPEDLVDAEVPEAGDQQLGLMARPRGNDWLADEIRGLQMRGVHTLVCLLERSELYELGLAEEAQTCEDQGIQFVYYPIEDISTPKDERSFLKLIQDLEERIGRSEKVVIHCRMGIGRSSVVAAAVLIRKGFPKEAVFDHISAARELSVPDTEEQREWVMRMDF